MEVYLDVLLIENFIVNYFLLYITSQMLRVKLRVRDYALGAVVGSLYVIVLFLPSLRLLTTLPFKLIFTLLIVTITFKKKDILFLIKGTAIFFLSSFLLAGLCVYIEWQNLDIISVLNGKIKFTYKESMMAIMIIYVSFNRIYTYLKDRFDISKLVYDVKIITKSSQLTIKAFLDTGNELREPATNLPVMVVDKNLLRKVDLELYDKFYIPYQVVNGSGGSLEGFKPEYIELSLKGKVERREVIIAYNDSTLSGAKEYRALLSRGII